MWNSAEYMWNSAAGSWPASSFSSSLNSHQWVYKQLPLHQAGWYHLCRLPGLPPHCTQPLPELRHLLKSCLCGSQGACSCSLPHEKQRAASNSTGGRIGSPCGKRAYQLVTLTDSICGESLWKMQSIMQRLLIFCFCCIYSWFMALRGG